VPGERFRAHVRVHEKAVERAQNVGHLEYEVAGLQRRGRVPGHVAAEHGHPAQLRDALRQVRLELGALRIHVAPDQDLRGRHQLPGFLAQYVLGFLDLGRAQKRN